MCSICIHVISLCAKSLARGTPINLKWQLVHFSILSQDFFCLFLKKFERDFKCFCLVPLIKILIIIFGTLNLDLDEGCMRQHDITLKNM